ncbi:hypothetical protein EXIGLDRAFT_494383 [Exidia glandulosa HHB12029]|uniref:Uncharacterized protein n=1 Tax=Exidia glandulosa HHB12029 TaxID=1314781 RepID=A0A165JJJ0_EXIGL|nr:hypothetical protein EXIGLDRAFT_494383 [Exidia glandulosa HHB12029]
MFAMLVVDDPSVLDRPVEYGTFVVISIDPVASVAPLQNEQATKEAAEIRSKRYLALVKKSTFIIYLQQALQGLVLPSKSSSTVYRSRLTTGPRRLSRQRQYTRRPAGNQ